MMVSPRTVRESGFPQEVMSASRVKADMCTALAHVRFGSPRRGDQGRSCLAFGQGHPRSRPRM